MVWARDVNPLTNYLGRKFGKEIREQFAVTGRTAYAESSAYNSSDAADSFSGITRARFSLQVIPMLSVRTTCPQCHGLHVVDLADLLYSPRVDYFRCCACSCWWSVPKGADEPATLGVLSDLDTSAHKAV